LKTKPSKDAETQEKKESKANDQQREMEEGDIEEGTSDIGEASS
jgi:hypothetical protein